MKRTGYTLFEMTIVLALLILLAGLAAPSIEGMYADYRLQAAVDDVRGRWASLRVHAISEGRPYRFAVNGADFRVAPDAAEFWEGGGDASVSTQSDPPPLVAQDSLPRGVRFAGVNAGDLSSPDGLAPAAGPNAGGWSTVAVFLPDGTAQQDVEIRFQSPESGPISLRLRALTGGMTSRWVSANGSR